jgi:hypothetical protein
MSLLLARRPLRPASFELDHELGDRGVGAASKVVPIPPPLREIHPANHVDVDLAVQEDENACSP